MNREKGRGERLLSDALDRIDEAIHLLREYAREKKEEAEALEDILYFLEEAGEALERIIRSRERTG
ncbi:MAG: hypothetical protein QW518_01545 [Thermofilaceae archaeon]